MAYKRLQNTLTESKLLLPFAALVCAAACYLVGLVASQLYVQLLCVTLATAMLIELNRSNQLIRTESHSPAAMYLFLVGVSIFTFPDLGACIMQLCMVALYFMLFHCRQHDESPGWVFYGFFCLGLASMVFVQVLYYVPVLWLLMATCLRALTARTFWASLLGLATPYWLSGPVLLYFLGPEVAVTHFTPLLTFMPLGDYSMLGEHEWAAVAWTVVLAVLGIIHYGQEGYQDKTRTRLLHEIFITIDLLTIFFLFLQPQHYVLLLSIIIVNTCPLIAHFLTLTHSWLTNILSVLILLITLLLITYNTWMPSSSFLSAMATQVCSYLPL